MPTIIQMRKFTLALTGVAMGFAATLATGLLFRTESVTNFDVELFESIVPRLQEHQWLSDASETLTKMGSIPLDYGMALAIGLFGAVVHRQAVFAILVPMTLAGAHAFQNLTIEIVQRDIPRQYVIGDSGGFFSGGVMRVIIVAAMLLTLAIPRLNSIYVYGIALGLGLLEGFTRLVLGRHWPLDIVIALPIGLGIAWAFRSVAFSWFPPEPKLLELDY